MSEIRLISPRQDLIQSVAEYLCPRGGNDFSSSVVVFPGKRPAHFLRKLLAEKTGGSIVPPRVFSIDHFIEFILIDRLGIRRKLVDTVDAIALLHDVHLRLNSRLGGTSYESLDVFIPLAIKLFSELEEVAMADVSQRQLRETVGGLEHPKFHALTDYYERFYQEIDQRGCFTRSTMYRTVADSLSALDLGSFERIVFAGLFAFTNVEARILSYFRELDNVAILFQNGAGLRNQLEKLNIEADDCELENVAVEEPQLNFYRAPDEHGQIFALAAKLKERLDSGGVLDEHSAIMLPSAEALFPVIHGALSLINEDAFNISLGYQLTRTPVFGFINNLLELVSGSFRGRFSAEAYLRFALHPYTKNIRLGQRSDLTRIAFHRIEEFLGKRKAKFLLTLDELENDQVLYDFVMKGYEGLGEAIIGHDLQQHVKEIHDQTIRKFQSFSSLADFAQKSIEALTFISHSSTASLHPYFRPYAERFIDVLDGIRGSLLGEKRFENIAAYAAFLRQYISTQSVPFPGAPLKGLQVLGLLETRNLKFDTLYILDANDDVIPSTPIEDLLLPQPVRQKLGLQTSRDREHLSQYYFNLAVEGAHKVHIFYTEPPTGGKEKSRFVQKIIWNKEREARRLLQKDLEQQVRYRVNLANQKPPSVSKTQPVIDFLHKGNRFSATQLDAYLACPLKFYYSAVLNLKEKVEVSEDTDQREIGSLVHRILREFFAARTGRILKPEEMALEDLNATVNCCFTEEYGAELLGSTLFLRQQVRLQLGRFLQQYQLPLAQSTKIVITSVEQKLTAEHGGVQFTGTIDRIETRDGKLFILDYKTGRDDASVKIHPQKIDLAEHKSWRKGIGSFQLPMYMLLYAGAKQETIEAITAAYLFLGRNEINMEIESRMGEGEYAAAAAYRAVEPVIFRLIEEILDINAPFTPTDRLDDECPRCPYKVICGTTWAGGWKQ